MKGKFGKIGIISLALVLALGTVGAAFAYWTETLDISTTASTGELRLELTNIECSDNSWDKLISWEETSSDSVHTFTFTIVDAYPGYVGRCSFDIENTGTIPAKICVAGSYMGSAPAWANIDIDNTLSFNGLPVIMNPRDFYGDRYIEVTINEQGIGMNDSVVECEENYSFTFTVTILSKQWNAPCP